MRQHELHYLREMGIQSYQLVYPERMQGYQAEPIDLQTSCKLLLVSPTCPEDKTALLFERVLKSMHLTLDDALHLYPEQIDLLREHQLQWIWFAGCESSEKVRANVLTSVELAHIEGDNQQRRSLWQQICSYQ